MSSQPKELPPDGSLDPSAEGGRTVLPAVAGLVLVLLLSALSQTVLATALPTMAGVLGGADRIAWVMTSFLLASTVVMPVYGRFGDRWGCKPLLAVALLLFTAGSLVGGLAADMSWLIAGRVVQGLGAGGMMVLPQAALAELVPVRRRGKYMGAMGGAFAVASVVGPLLGGWFTEGPGWRWVFLANVPLGLVAMALIAVLMPVASKTGGTRAPVDVMGILWVTVATTAVVLMCTWGGQEHAWSSPVIIGLALVALAAVPLFLLAEHRAAEPVMPLSLFTDRNFVLTTVGAFVIGAAMFGAVGYLPTYLQMAAGASATAAGLLMMPMMGAVLLASVVTGGLISRTGRYKVFPVLGTLVMGAALTLLSTLTVDAGALLVGGCLVLFGAGIGASLQVLTLVVQSSFPGDTVGTATAATNYFRQIGSSLGAAVIGSLFVTRLANLLVERGVRDAGDFGSMTPESVAALPEAARSSVVGAYNDALLPLFLAMVPLLVASAVALMFVHEKPLAEDLGAEGRH